MCDNQSKINKLKKFQVEKNHLIAIFFLQINSAL